MSHAYVFLIKNKIALTIMDGKSYSLYPYYDIIHTLASVRNTPLGESEGLKNVIRIMNSAKENSGIIRLKRKVFAKMNISSSIPVFE